MMAIQQHLLTTFDQVADPKMIGRQYSALGQTFTVSANIIVDAVIVCDKLVVLDYVVLNLYR